MLRRLYDWTMSLARTRHAERSLAAVSFVESSFFPIPPDVLLIPMVLAERARWIRYALICTVASVLGALLAGPTAGGAGAAEGCSSGGCRCGAGWCGWYVSGVG